MSCMAPHVFPSIPQKCDDENEGDNGKDINDWSLPICFDSPRHNEAIEAPNQIEHTWRLKEKYKTHCVALVLCLNVGVDPPDIVKTQPCAQLECWVDPQSMSSGKALETIGHNLQQQYERWQPRARYKLSLDPTSEDVKKLCCSLRRNAKDERVLFHYNGHGVPKPTSRGEIWVFNRAFTQYIPLSVYDLQTWMGAPSLYVYDCSNAGVVVEQFKSFAIQHEDDYERAQKSNPTKQEDASGAPSVPPCFKNCIQLAACSAGETLPMNPELPADLFTACLTTPVKMAMKWFVIRNLTARIAPTNIGELIDKIPGQVTDRRTMFGELNWIFTAITDTIAWNSLPQDLFQQLFRADLLTASLCRNFLLADRILRSYNCTPVSSPAFPSLASHPMWQAWDQTLDLALAQLPDMLGPQQLPYQHSPFFKEQLTAFQVWLDLGSPSRPPPDQLPMVLQVLLSTLHRVRALDILCKFLALGEWAVRAVLAVGIFPYMVKLLQASANDLRASMVCIWAKIMAVDGTCQVDLVNAKGHKYFLQILQDSLVKSDYRTMAAFVLAGIVDNYPPGQEAALQGSLISICLEQLNDSNKSLRTWLAICLGRLWRDYDTARWSGVRDLAHEKLYQLLDDPHPEVRSAAVFALGTFVQRSGARSEHSDAIDRTVALTLARRAPHDASPLVRAQILEALQWLVLTFEPHFINVSLQEKRTETPTKGRERRQSQMVESGQDALEGLPTTTSLQSLPMISFTSAYMMLWSTLNSLCSDPHPQVSFMANEIVTFINNQTLQMKWNAQRDIVDVRYGSCSSLPPSPNSRASTLPHAGGRRVRSLMQNTITEDSGICASPSDLMNTSTSSTNSSSSQKIKKAIVKTEFVEWASSQFSKCTVDSDWQKDEECRLYQARKWFYSRNRRLRREAKELANTSVSLETRIFHARCQMSPSVIKFHPYEQSIAFASRDTFGVWDLKTENTLCTGVWKNSGGRISALEYANGHDFPLLVLASSIGSIAVFRPVNGKKEPQLVTAWSGLDVRNFNYPEKKPTSQFGGYQGGSLIAWCDRKCTLTVGGPARYIRVWDARRELRLLDISIDKAHSECDSGVTALSRHGNMIWCGLGSGGVRCWDDRTPTRTVISHQDHGSPILLADLTKNTLVTACTKGELRYYDLRTNFPIETVHTGSSLTAVAMHQYANLVACGSPLQSISIYNLNGDAPNTIRSHEGFMAGRVGPVSCLAFHPLRSTPNFKDLSPSA